MKTKDLIQLLQEADPTGESQACVGNCDIHFVSRMPAYYDGTLQVLDRNENSKYYNITGGRYVRSGDKVVIYALSIRDAISNNPKDFPVDYSELTEQQAKVTKSAHDELREWHRRTDNELERQLFFEWANKECAKLTVDTEEISGEITRFFERNVSPDDPLPDGKILAGHSYASTREIQWSERFEVLIDEGFLKIRKR